MNVLILLFLKSGLNVAIFIFMSIKCVNQMFNEVQTSAVDTITLL